MIKKKMEKKSEEKLEEKKINLQIWDSMENLKNKFFSMICFASRRSGKSELIKFIYTKLNFGKEYDYVAVIAESDQTIDFFSEFVHGNLFIRKFDSSTIENIMKISEKIEADGKQKRFLVIVDDVVGNNAKYSESLRKLYAVGRHYNISCILICQQLTLINTTVRNNSDIILIGKTKNAQEKTSIRDNILDGIADDDEIKEMGFDNKKEFYNYLLKRCTEDYHFIVLDDIANNGNNFNNVVRIIKADLDKVKHTS